MKCRNMVNDTVVWFGAIGKDSNGNTIFANEQHQSYADGTEGTATSLTQRLSVIKGELWYNVSYGIPLLDKIKSKAQMDIAVLKIVNEHPDVLNVVNFASSVVNHVYTCEMVIKSKYGNIELTV